MTWTQQTHHPYEPTPGIEMLGLARDRVVDAYNFERYLNVLHETDRQLARVFESVRRSGRERDTSSWSPATTGRHSAIRTGATCRGGRSTTRTSGSRS